MKTRHPVLTPECYDVVERIMLSGELSSFTGTPEGHQGGFHVRALEDAFCDYFRVKYAVAMNSATSCLHASMITCGVDASHTVIVTPYTMSASASCILMAHGKPVFADIDRHTFCITADTIRPLITKNTQAIVVVHLMGHPADMDSIMELADRHGIYVIEDSAQALGAVYKGRKTGTIGDCGIFSFNQSKAVSTGEGGMLITNDEFIARVARAVRNHGEVSDPDLNIVGYNYRLCEIEAAIALKQFEKLDEMNNYRIHLCNYITSQLSQIDGLTPPVVQADCKHVYYTYGVKFDKNKLKMHRNEFQEKLLKRGVYFGKGYVKPLYLLPIYETLFDYSMGLCPVAEKMFTERLMVTDILRYPLALKDCERIIKIMVEELKRV